MVATPVQPKLNTKPLTIWGSLVLLAALLTGCASLERPVAPGSPDLNRQRQERALDEDFGTEAPRTDVNAVVDKLQRQALEEQAGGRLEAAAGLLERALRIDNQDVGLYQQMAEVRLSQGRFAQAEQVALRGLSEAGSDPGRAAALWQIIAQARSGQGNIQGARQAREQACRSGGC